MSSILAITYDTAVAVTIGSARDPAGPFAGLLVTATGNVTFTTLKGDSIALTSVAANVIIPIAVRNVTATTGTVLGLLTEPYTTKPST